jgi:hypothetical protein
MQIVDLCPSLLRCRKRAQGLANVSVIEAMLHLEAGRAGRCRALLVCAHYDPGLVLRGGQR